MNLERILIIPHSWMKEASETEGRLNNKPSFRIIPVPDYENEAKQQLKKILNPVLKNSDAQSALVVLPLKYASGAFVKYWPELIVRTKLGILVTSICFADCWTGCRTIVYPPENNSQTKSDTYNATCQYQPPYTETFDRWMKAGARGFHPGDYSKTEFLNSLNKMKGHWLYWGHSDHSKLRGYQHLHSEDLLSHKPELPLHSTLWFSCSTLGANKQKAIALDWFLAGSTHCMLAGIKNIETTANLTLSASFLEAVRQNGSSTLDGILHLLLKKDQQTFAPILKKYRLLGPPWIKFSSITHEIPKKCVSC